MFTVNTQLHGYRQGHQLLDSTVTLSKADQSVVDRLSDVAGPLRPGELFDSYLSAYPLPSDQFYVLARTWQDLTVKRAGCVRTLSVIIPIDKWKNAGGLQSFLDLLNPQNFPSTAASAELVGASAALLPQTPEFRASELLEALFLEDLKPVALFAAPQPELIAVRLLTALWPTLRRRFALSTFALSPRKIEGRNFDLVFAPRDTRSRFADWPGRRIDARAGTAARHRWSSVIVERVFQSPMPWLLADRDLRLIGDKESSTPAALRIALLWDELLAKLERSPSAALGLVDIAVSRMHSHSTALRDLQPVLATAAQRAVESLPAAEAWDLLGAMVTKIMGTSLMPALHAVADSVAVLSDRSPVGAIVFLDQADRADAVDAMVAAVASGLTAHFGVAAERALANARMSTFRRLVVANHQLARATLVDPTLVERMERILIDLEPPLFITLRDGIMPALVDDAHANLARLLFPSLNRAGVFAEVKHLYQVNRFHSKSLLPPLIDQSRRLSAIEELRSTLLSLPPSAGGNEFLRMTLRPVTDDVWWLLQNASLSTEATNGLLQDVVRQADVQQFQDLLVDTSLAPVLLERLADRPEILLRAVTEGQLPLELHVSTVLQLLPQSSVLQSRELATNLVAKCLQAHFGDDEIATLLTLFATLGSSLDGGWVARIGLDRLVPTSVVNRNLVVFNKLIREARQRLLLATEEFAERLAARFPFDLDEDAAAACAALLWDARSVNLTGLLQGAGRLLPTLFRSGQAPVSAIIATTFPLIYRELAREDDVPNVFKFVPFFDWDRCKAARHELVKTFLASDMWRPSDLALTACRALDVGKILRRVAKSSCGETYITKISADLKMLPNPCRVQVKRMIMQIQSDQSAKHDRRD